MKKHRRQNLYRSERNAAILMLTPSCIGLSVFFLFPFIDTIRRSLFDSQLANYRGLSNYLSVINNKAFRLAAWNTLRFVIVCIPLLMGVSLCLALLIRAFRPSGRIFKTGFLAPMALPVASMVLLWQLLFSDRGLINSYLFAFFGVSVNFMNSEASFGVLVGTYVWKNAGYNMILWLAGLDSIPENLYEAAKVDGAGAFHCFRYITLPSLGPTIGLSATLSLLNSFKVFREAYLVAGPYPHEGIYLLQHLFNNWFQNLDISRLCATAVILAAVLLIYIIFIQKQFSSTLE